MTTIIEDKRGREARRKDLTFSVSSLSVSSAAAAAAAAAAAIKRKMLGKIRVNQLMQEFSNYNNLSA
jgi:hypothetical protein